MKHTLKRALALLIALLLAAPTFALAEEPTEGITTGFERKYRKEGRPIYRSIIEFEK